jgi:4-hydroxy-3-methylbut-2-en-1-yl diphosphate reductase
MRLCVERAREIGFCFGVKRALDILEKAVGEHGKVETLGALVHNEQVLKKLQKAGINVALNVADIKGNVAAISSHGVSPEIEDEIRRRNIEIIDTTCPCVRRAQIAAQRLVKAGFFVIIFGDTGHPEVKGILGWAKGKSLATREVESVLEAKGSSRRLGILSQTTQIPEQFTGFVKGIIDFALTKDAEIRIIDTICPDIRRRQRTALDLANKVDLMLVIGGHNSANTRHLAELCAAVRPAYLIEKADELEPSWFHGCQKVGIASGTSTPEETIEEVLARLEEL